MVTVVFFAKSRHPQTIETFNNLEDILLVYIMTNPFETTYDCIVIGAGIAGLIAARNLQRQGHSVLVLKHEIGTMGECSANTSRLDRGSIGAVSG
jgi:NAD(P)H-nitrite reductase large subunit